LLIGSGLILTLILLIHPAVISSRRSLLPSWLLRLYQGEAAEQQACAQKSSNRRAIHNYHRCFPL
jgi:hypothetical protein